MWDKINSAVPALGYNLRTVEATGWKVNFDPDQPRDEDWKLRINEQDRDGNEGRWVTMNGTPVFIKDGEDPKEAATRAFRDKPPSRSQPIQAQKKEGFFKRAWREAKEDIGNYLNPKVPDMPNKPTPPAPGRGGVSTKLQRIREVGLGERETVAELFFKKHVDDLYSGKMSTVDKVNELMGKGVIKTGTEKPETVRERAVKDFNKAVALREQQTADRLTSGEGKRAYTDKTLRAGLGRGETLAERYFAGHVDDLYDGNTSVTAKVDDLIGKGELGFGRGDKGFLKMRETAIKDFTRALNLREAHDVKLEKQKLADAKPRKLTKREQQAEWTPSEEELAESGPVVGSGTGWKRNMAENQPRDEKGRWTGVGWHGTRRTFDVFDTKAPAASRTGTAADQPPFVYFSASPEKATPYAMSKRSGDGRPRLIQANLYMNNPLDITKAVKRGRKKGLPFGEAKRAALAELTDAHDGFLYAGDMYNAPEYAVRDISQIQVVTQPKQNAFDPNQPRDKDGKWTGGTLNFSNEPERVGGFTKDVAVRRSTVMKGKERVISWHNPDGSQITDPKLVARAERLNGTKATAPNYKGAWLNPDTDSPLLAIAFDAKDRKHYVYSKEFEQGNAAEKFKIVAQMEKDLPAMRAQAARDRKAGSPEAHLFKLEDLTCMRVGSNKDTGAAKKAYGLTTLRGEHVKVEGDLIKLKFPAKGGATGSYTVKDRELAAFITGRKAANGNGPLWPDVSASRFNAYLKTLDPTPDTPVTAHKFRHYHATRIAAGVVARYEGTELDRRAFARVQREACEKAAAHLSNTWTVTRDKYVNPTVWGRLAVKAV